MCSSCLGVVAMWLLVVVFVFLQVCQRLSPTARSSNLRSSPKKTELFQVVHGGEKKAKDTSDDTRHISDDTRHTSDDTRHTSDDKRDASDDAGPKKKLKFTSVQSAKGLASYFNK